ncbi:MULTISPECIES: hypothetical protein [Achromobacter]|uniref:hypothetical protein n=1 Tax=Achromobacter TaxID=222 RepID=UPI0023F89C2B|nr:hypothetical protein [Achromobacter anxifer]MDF8365109.1 hypothetical protein [Achromobacter anxifer]
MLTLEGSIQPTPFLVMVDEFADFARNPDDELTRELRDTPGIPNAEFQLMDTGVFVFRKLVANVQAWGEGSEPSLPADIPSLIAGATVSALEAVTEWSIVPRPFELVTDDSGEKWIRHSELGTLLPDSYSDQETASMALARLLRGELIEGPGDFHVRGQSMRLESPLSLDQLPPLPALDLPAGNGSTYLGDRTIQSGFAPVTPQFQRDLTAAEERWVSLQQAVRERVASGMPDLWHRAARVEWPARSDERPSDHAAEALPSLRRLYPELHRLSDVALCCLFDTYQLVCWDDYLWDAHRDDEFLLFLLAQILPTEDGNGTRGDCFSILENGRWIGAALLQGATTMQAIAIAREAQAYGRAFHKLLWRVRTAMGFLQRVPTGLVEPLKIKTFIDLVAGARLMNPTLTTVTQDLSDFAAAPVGIAQ